MSLYNHVENKDALLDGIVEAMSWEAEPPPAADTGWRDALRRLAAGIRAVIRRHPAAAPLLALQHGRPVQPRHRPDDPRPGLRGRQARPLKPA